MRASVNVNYLGSPEVEKELKERLREMFKEHPGTWEVGVLGGANTIWEVKVKGPDDRGYRVKKLYGEDGSFEVEKVVEEVSRLAEKTKKSA